jgi:hypothetical protein
VSNGNPVQITLGNLKLSFYPLPSGPEIEFTDFATDISWLSGRHLTGLITVDNPSHMYTVLDRVECGEIENGLMIRAMLGPLTVTIGYRLRAEPNRLEERTVVANTSDRIVHISELRIGPTWCPPISWMLNDELEIVHGEHGLIITDKKRYLYATEVRGKDKILRLPVTTWIGTGKYRKLAIGGIALNGKAPDGVCITHEYEIADDATVYHPGVGGPDEALEIEGRYYP